MISPPLAMLMVVPVVFTEVAGRDIVQIPFAAAEVVKFWPWKATTTWIES